MEKGIQALNWNDRDILKTVKDTVAANATESEFKMFALLAQSTGLNPLKKEIWFTKSNDYEDKKGNKIPGKANIMTGINGFYAIANAHAEYDGIEIIESDAFHEIKEAFVAEWDNGKLVSRKYPVSPPIKVPEWIEARVYRKDRSRPSVARAKWLEYSQDILGKYGKRTIWGKLSTVQLSKCAEAMALRKAFSQQLNGLYVEEEIRTEVEVEDVAEGGSDSKDPVVAPVVDPRTFYDLGVKDENGAPLLDERARMVVQKYLEGEGAVWDEELAVYISQERLKKATQCIVSREAIDLRLKKRAITEDIRAREIDAESDARERIGAANQQFALNADN